MSAALCHVVGVIAGAGVIASAAPGPCSAALEADFS
jgi:hypothetical protein